MTSRDQAGGSPSVEAQVEARLAALDHAVEEAFRSGVMNSPLYRDAMRAALAEAAQARQENARLREVVRSVYAWLGDLYDVDEPTPAHRYESPPGAGAMLQQMARALDAARPAQGDGQ
jgi:hypothetical protein